MADGFFKEIYYALRIAQLVAVVFLPVGIFYLIFGHLQRLARIAAGKETASANRLIQYGVLVATSVLMSCASISFLLQGSWIPGCVIAVLLPFSCRATWKLRPKKRKSSEKVGECFGKKHIC